MNSIKTIKNDIRLRLLEQRQNIPESEKRAAEEQIINTISSLASFRFAKTLLLYYPIRNELDITPLIEISAKLGKKAALPISNKDEPEMDFFYISSKSELVKGAFGIMEPKKDAEKYIPENSDSAICIIPAVAYDTSGHRLGYGKGYYDRFLTRFHGTRLGICMSDMLLNELPHGKYDIPVNAIITEKGLTIPNG